MKYSKWNSLAACTWSFIQGGGSQGRFGRSGYDPREKSDSDPTIKKTRSRSYSKTDSISYPKNRIPIRPSMTKGSGFELIHKLDLDPSFFKPGSRSKFFFQSGSGSWSEPCLQSICRFKFSKLSSHSEKSIFKNASISL